MRQPIATVIALAIAGLMRLVELNVAATQLPLAIPLSVALGYAAAAAMPTVRNSMLTNRQYHITALIRHTPLLLETSMLLATLGAMSMGHGAAALYQHWGGWAKMAAAAKAIVIAHAVAAPLLIITVVTIGEAVHNTIAAVLVGTLLLGYASIEFYLFRCETFHVTPATVVSVTCAVVTIALAVAITPQIVSVVSPTDDDIMGRTSLYVAAIEILTLLTVSAAYMDLLTHEDPRPSANEQRRFRRSARRPCAGATRSRRNREEEGAARAAQAA